MDVGGKATLYDFKCSKLCHTGSRQSLQNLRNMPSHLFFAIFHITFWEGIRVLWNSRYVFPQQVIKFWSEQFLNTRSISSSSHCARSTAYNLKAVHCDIYVCSYYYMNIRLISNQ